MREWVRDEKEWIAFHRIITSHYKNIIIEALKSSKSGLSAKQLYEASMSEGYRSKGTLYYHLRDLEWLGVVAKHEKSYKLTDFGLEIVKKLEEFRSL